MKPDFRRAILLLILTATLTFPTGCRSSQAPADADAGPRTPGAARQASTYHGVGVVKSINADRPSIEIDHQEVKDLMPAMTMEFHVQDRTLLDGITPGDRVEFVLENGVGGVKIIEIKKR